MEINFINATLDDTDAILKLVHQLEHFISKATLLNNLKNNLEDKNYRIFTAKENDIVVAFAELHFTQFIHEENKRVRLTSFCVDEKYRSKNIGSLFLKFIENYCKDNHVFNIELTSNVRRTKAHHFYEKNGYVFTSKRFSKKL